MTTLAYILENKTSNFEEGDKVVMHSCFESELEEYKDKIWKCQTPSFLARCNSEVVFLEDFSGYFLTKFLRKV